MRAVVPLSLLLLTGCPRFTHVRVTVSKTGAEVLLAGMHSPMCASEVQRVPDLVRTLVAQAGMEAEIQATDDGVRVTASGSPEGVLGLQLTDGVWRMPRPWFVPEEAGLPATLEATDGVLVDRESANVGGVNCATLEVTPPELREGGTQEWSMVLSSRLPTLFAALETKGRDAALEVLDSWPVGHEPTAALRSHYADMVMAGFVTEKALKRGALAVHTDDPDAVAASWADSAPKKALKGQPEGSTVVLKDHQVVWSGPTELVDGPLLGRVLELELDGEDQPTPTIMEFHRRAAAERNGEVAPRPEADFIVSIPQQCAYSSMGHLCYDGMMLAWMGHEVVFDRNESGPLAIYAVEEGRLVLRDSEDRPDPGCVPTLPASQELETPVAVAADDGVVLLADAAHQGAFSTLGVPRVDPVPTLPQPVVAYVVDGAVVAWAAPLQASVERFRSAGLGPSIAELAEGQKLYERNCQACHAYDRPGIGPVLFDDEWIHGGSEADVLRVIREGVPAKGMPAWGPILGAKRVELVTDYLLRGTPPD